MFLLTALAVNWKEKKYLIEKENKVMNIYIH